MDCARAGVPPAAKARATALRDSLILIVYFLLLKPESHAHDVIRHARVFPCGACKIGTLTDPPLLGDADIGREFACELVAKTQTCLDPVEASANAEFGNILSRKSDFGSRLEDQPLRDALIKLALEARGYITLVRYERCNVDLELVGSNALYANDSMGALGSC